MNSQQDMSATINYLLSRRQLIKELESTLPAYTSLHQHPRYNEVLEMERAWYSEVISNVRKCVTILFHDDCEDKHKTNEYIFRQLDDLRVHNSVTYYGDECDGKIVDGIGECCVYKSRGRRLIEITIKPPISLVWIC